jgi:hypothetical protein
MQRRTDRRIGPQLLRYAVHQFGKGRVLTEVIAQLPQEHRLDKGLAHLADVIVPDRGDPGSEPCLERSPGRLPSIRAGRVGCWARVTGARGCAHPQRTDERGKRAERISHWL